MGASGSRVKRMASTFLSGGGGNNNNDVEDYDDEWHRNQSKVNSFWELHSPLVFSRRGSMYIDEDGDIAHEFYVEVPSTEADHKTVMKRITTNLKPQGIVVHEFPRINANLPVILRES